MTPHEFDNTRFYSGMCQKIETKEIKLVKYVDFEERTFEYLVNDFSEDEVCKIDCEKVEIV